jgi:phosphoglycolate phosphatase-like HAD superfamily hydrolase
VPTSHSASIWLRPGLTRDAFYGSAPAVDAALFDVDGVLIETTRSWRLAVIAAVEVLVRSVHGLGAGPSALVAPTEVALFKRAGGFNSDWDLARCLAALWTARLREWHGQPSAQRTLVDWAAQASMAARKGCRGIAWLQTVVPATAIPDAETARWVCDEFYWGAALVRELFGHEPRYAPEAEGFVANERLLLEQPVLPALVACGIKHFGLITGRLGPEVNWALRQLAPAYGLAEGGAVSWHDSPFGRSPFGCIVPATLYAKPDPRALAHALQALAASAALYVGDTADDLDVVLRYRREPAPAGAAAAPVLAICVAEGEDALAYQARGADIVIAHVRDLPPALETLGIRPQQHG